MKQLNLARLALFGETWLLPVSVGFLVSSGIFMKLATPDLWEQIGGLLLLAGALAILVLLVERRTR
ncbi:MAG: hypothetical protein QOI31_497 [Solirubrobacterales bacterium]|jgi:hypothetical protein|nr:hypothetical protein [Solirubrobacterales bacterium]